MHRGTSCKDSKRSGSCLGAQQEQIARYIIWLYAGPTCGTQTPCFHQAHYDLVPLCQPPLASSRHFSDTALGLRSGYHDSPQSILTSLAPWSSSCP